MGLIEIRLYWWNTEYGKVARGCEHGTERYVSWNGGTCWLRVQLQACQISASTEALWAIFSTGSTNVRHVSTGCLSGVGVVAVGWLILIWIYWRRHKSLGSTSVPPISPTSPRGVPGSILGQSMWGFWREVALGQPFRSVFLFSPVSIIPPVLHTHIHVQAAVT